MQIANPMYDVVFKRLMENEKIARFFISTILDLEVLSLQIKSREFTYQGENDKIHLFRLDFIALLKTPDGPKKVLIEVQKSRKLLKADTLRFRTYLGEQYSRRDKIDDQDELLNIITIYILGFNLGGIKTPYLRVRRSYEDGLTGALIEGRHKFVEGLSHDSHYIQAARIEGKWSNRLERLLSIFEQRYFKDKKFLKDYPYPVGDDLEIGRIVETLYRAGSDGEIRRQLTLEAEAWSKMEEMIEESRAKDKALAEKEEALAEKDKTIDAQGKALTQAQQKALEAQQRATEAQRKASEQERIIAELRKKLGDPE